MKHILTSTFLFLLFTNLTAQVKIGGTPVAPDASAVLELDGGNNRGLLLPRMRKMDIDAIVNPAEGLTIYATDEQAVYLRKSLVWEKQAPFSLPFKGTYTIDNDTSFRVANLGNLFSTAISGLTSSGCAILGFASASNGSGVKGITSHIEGIGGLFTNYAGGTGLVAMGKTGIGTGYPFNLLEINGKDQPGNTIIIDDDDDPTIQFRKAGINKSFIKQQGNDLVLRPNDQNFNGKVILQAYNQGGWMFLDAAGDVSVGIDPTGFNGTPLGSRMNIRDNGGINLTLDAPVDNINGPTLKFLNKVGNVTTEYGSVKTNSLGLQLNSSSATTFNGLDRWVWKSTNDNYLPAMQLRMGPGLSELGADLLVSNGIGIGVYHGNYGNIPNAALDINLGFSWDKSYSEVMHLSGKDLIVRLKQSGVDKGFIQLVDDDMKTGTFATNNKGRFIIRTNNADRLWVDSVGYVTIGGKIGPTLNGPYKLAVKGKIAATDFNVVASGSWPDYVFDPSYKLRSLEETEAYINEHKHLPNIPAAAVVDKEGFALGDMQKRMMEKIEELTLYLIDAKKEINILKQQVKGLQPKQ
jgi:hypothetical protein